MGSRYWDKCGNQLIKENLAFMRLPYDIKGMYFEMRLMAGEPDCADGTFPLGGSKRATLDDVIDYFADGEKGRYAYIRKAMARLKSAGGIKESASGVVKIATYEEEQQLGRTDDTNRMRDHRQQKFEDRVRKVQSRLTSYVKSDHGPGLERLCKWVCLEVGCKGPTADKIIDRLVNEKILRIDRREGTFSVLNLGGGLAASPLAPPAEAVAGTEADCNMFSRTCYRELEEVSVTESDSNESQLNSTEAAPTDHKLSAGTAAAEGGASGEAAVGSNPVGRAVRGERGKLPAQCDAPVNGPPYPCDQEPDAVDVYCDDPEKCARYFCPDGDRDTWKVIRSKLIKHGEGVFRDVLKEMQTDLLSGDWKTMKSHARVFMAKFKQFKS